VASLHVGTDVWNERRDGRRCSYRMIPKSVKRFSDKIMRRQRAARR